MISGILCDIAMSLPFTVNLFDMTDVISASKTLSFTALIIAPKFVPLPDIKIIIFFVIFLYIMFNVFKMN
jgi:hypothetical protein